MSPSTISIVSLPLDECSPHKTVKIWQIQQNYIFKISI
uniref:Uncharacterized protein n=1 Tax=Anguilla anguilla TaxID=7936 RepID=A0A0E9SCG2_ANGAN